MQITTGAINSRGAIKQAQFHVYPIYRLYERICGCKSESRQAVSEDQPPASSCSQFRGDQADEIGVNWGRGGVWTWVSSCMYTARVTAHTLKPDDASRVQDTPQSQSKRKSTPSEVESPFC